ncbi:MAG: N-acetyltransferase family protein [Thermoplasmata archaeon]
MDSSATATPFLSMVPLLRPASLGDLPGIASIYNYYVAHSHSTFEIEPVGEEQQVESFRMHAGGGRYRFFVAERTPGEIIGYAHTGPFRPRAAYATTVESSVYCRPDATGQGVGRRLYDALFQAIAQEDIHRIVAVIAQPNPASVALHEKFGFFKIGVLSEVGRKLGRFWDVAYFERPLVLPPDASATT